MTSVSNRLHHLSARSKQTTPYRPTDASNSQLLSDLQPPADSQPHTDTQLLTDLQPPADSQPSNINSNLLTDSEASSVGFGVDVSSSWPDDPNPD